MFSSLLLILLTCLFSTVLLIHCTVVLMLLYCCTWFPYTGSVSPVMNKSKDHRGRSKTGRMSSTPRRHHDGTTESLSASVTSTPALIHSPRPRSANRTEINSALSTPRSGTRSEVNSTVSTPVLLNSPAKSSNIGRSLVTSGVKDKPMLAAKESKPPSGVGDGISKPRRKQSDEMSKSFELHLQTDFTVDSSIAEKKMNKSTSSSQDIQVKLSSKENLEQLKCKSSAADDSRSKQKTSSDNGKAQSKVKDSSIDTSSVKENSKLKSVKEDMKAKLNLSVDDKAKPRLQSTQVRTAAVDAKKPTGDEKKMPKKSMGTKSTMEEEKLKSKISTDKIKVKQCIDEEKKTNVGDEKEKVEKELSEKDKSKQGSFTGSQVKPKPSTVTKSGHDEAKKKLLSDTSKDSKHDTSPASDKEIKKNGQPELKKEKVSGETACQLIESLLNE